LYALKMGAGWLLKSPGDLLKFATGFRKKKKKAASEDHLRYESKT
jgi:hypothetical protein